MTRFIAVLSGKGGVGKTTVAINLAEALNQLGRDIIVLDGNLTTPDVGLSLGMANVPVSFHDVVKGKNHLTSSVYLHSSGIRIIPGSIKLESIKDINLNNLDNVFRQLQGISEIVIMDLDAGLGTETLNMLKFADEALIVTNPDVASVAGALKAIKLAEEMDITVLGIVLNRVKGDSVELPPGNVQTFLERPLLSIIPESNNMREAKAKKQTLFLNKPNSELTGDFKRLAAFLVGEKYEHNLKFTEESFMHSMLKKLNLK